jgi:hypothetical protein
MRPMIAKGIGLRARCGSLGECRMMDIYRRVLCMGLAGLLFLFGMTGICLAEPNQTANSNECKGRIGLPGGDGMMCQSRDSLPAGVPIELVQSGHGFAFKGNESHILRLNVEALCPLEPMQVRDMLATNKSVDEIRNDIRTKKCEAAYRGGLMLDSEIYSLINIIISPFDGNSTIMSADVADPRSMSAGNETVILGRFSLNASPSDGGIVGKGDLELGSSLKAGRYAVLLDMMPHGPREERGSSREMRR